MDRRSLNPTHENMSSTWPNRKDSPLLVASMMAMAAGGMLGVPMPIRSPSPDPFAPDQLALSKWKRERSDANQAKKRAKRARCIELAKKGMTP